MEAKTPNGYCLAEEAAGLESSQVPSIEEFQEIFGVAAKTIKHEVPLCL